jgi:hypothetical protein
LAGWEPRKWYKVVEDSLCFFELEPVEVIMTVFFGEALGKFELGWSLALPLPVSFFCFFCFCHHVVAMDEYLSAYTIDSMFDVTEFA